MKKISLDELKITAGEKGFNLFYIEKDYYLTLALYKLRELEGLVFKGGTALNKTLLNYSRLSEDLDFAATTERENLKKEIKDKLEPDFNSIKKEGSSRHTVRYKVSYKSGVEDKDSILLDLNFIAKSILETQKMKIPHFYKGYIPEFSFRILSEKELIAEKVRALITRHQPRDYYDVYQIIKKGYPIDISLVKKKVEEADEDFDIERIFRRANRIYSKWEKDLIPLASKEADFHSVIKVIENRFRN